MAAEPAAEDSLKVVRQQFMEFATIYGDRIKRAAMSVFRLFFLIGVAMFGVQVTLGRVEMADAIKEFITMLVFAAFCYFAIFYYREWTKWLMDTQLSLATRVTGKDIGHLAMNLVIVDLGFNILDYVLESINWINPASAVKGLAFIVITGVIICCIALIGSRMLIITCEAYIAMNIAVLLMGAGAFSVLKSYTINVIRFVFSLAFKIFTMEIIMAVGYDFLYRTSSLVQNNVTFQTLFIALVCSLVLLVLCLSIPETVAGIVNGAHTGSGAGLKAAAFATGAVIGNVAGKAYNTTAKTIGGAAAGIGAVSKAAKIASLEGHGGFSGTAGQLWRSYQEARQDEKRSGLPPSAIGESRRMDAMMTDRHEALKAVNNPDYEVSAYSKGRMGNEFANQGNADKRHEQLTDALKSNTAAMQAATQAFASAMPGMGGLGQGGDSGLNNFRMGDYGTGSFTGSIEPGDNRTQDAVAAQRKNTSQETPRPRRRA